MTNKSLTIILAGVIFFLLMMLTISTFLNNHLFNTVEDLRARLDYKEAALKVYEVNQAQIEAYDRQTWGDTVIWLESGESLWTYEGQKITSTLNTLDTMEVR